MFKQIILLCLVLLYAHCQDRTAACSNQGTLVSGFEDLPINNGGNPIRNLQSYSLQELQSQLSDTMKKLNDIRSQYIELKNQSINNSQIDLNSIQSDMQSLNQRIIFLQDQISKLQNEESPQPRPVSVIRNPPTQTWPSNGFPPFSNPPFISPPFTSPIISQPTQPSNVNLKNKVNCVVSSPPQQLLAQSKNSNSFSQNQKLAQTQQQSKAKWISPPSSLSKLALTFTFQSSCIYNPCPDNPYTLLVIASCPYKLYAVTQTNVLIQYLGSGSAWSWDWYTFTIPCGKFKLKLILKCPGSNSWLWFDLTQNNHNCTDCRNPVTQYFNPYTCKCQCSNKCQCNKPQIWFDYPSCYCGCPFVKKCDPVQQFWNAQTCRCQCLPICCDPWVNPGPPCC